MSEDKIRLMEIIGIFSALITFVSVEIKILEVANNVFILAGLSIVMFSGLSLFVSVIIQISEFWIRGARDFASHILFFTFATLILVTLGVALANKGYDIENKKIIESNSSSIELTIDNSSDSTTILTASSTRP